MHPSNPSSPSPSTTPSAPGTTDSPEHPSIAAFRAALAEAGGTGRIVVLPATKLES